MVPNDIQQHSKQSLLNKSLQKIIFHFLLLGYLRRFLDKANDLHRKITFYEKYAADVQEMLRKNARFRYYIL